MFNIVVKENKRTDSIPALSVRDAMLHLGVLDADLAREVNEMDRTMGRSSWSRILVEHVAAALEEAARLTVAPMDQYQLDATRANLRVELLQITNIAITWIDALDHRDG